MIKAIFFDSDGVLYRSGWKRAIQMSERLHRFPPGALYASSHDHQYWKDFTLGHISEQRYWQFVAENFVLVTGRRINQAELRRGVRRHTRMIPGMHGLVRRLSQKYTLGIISNYPKEWHHWAIQKFALRSIMTVAAVSGHVHTRKPDISIFRYALRQAHLIPSECVYIDDRPQKAIGAQQLGIKTITFHSCVQLKSELHRLQIL